MILLDTDVLIDITLDRHPHSEAASELLDRIEHGAEAAYIAWHSVRSPAEPSIDIHIQRRIRSDHLQDCSH